MQPKTLTSRHVASIKHFNNTIQRAREAQVGHQHGLVFACCSHIICFLLPFSFGFVLSVEQRFWGKWARSNIVQHNFQAHTKTKGAHPHVNGRQFQVWDYVVPRFKNNTLRTGLVCVWGGSLAAIVSPQVECAACVGSPWAWELLNEVYFCRCFVWKHFQEREGKQPAHSARCPSLIKT